MRAAVLVDPERPKAKKSDVVRMLKDAGLELAERGGDFGVVVGGDGIFSYYGRIMSTPLLFIGVRSAEFIASKAYLAEAYLDALPSSLEMVKGGLYQIEEYKRLEVAVEGRVRGEVFTDVYLEKGADSNCLRYELDVSGESVSFRDSAIANGVVLSTSAGATGYYSYLDRVRSGDILQPERHSTIAKDEVGVCHIAPQFTARSGSSLAPLRYTVPWGATFALRLMRDADARLFGISRSRSGLRIRKGETIEVRPSNNMTRVIRLESGRARSRPS